MDLKTIFIVDDAKDQLVAYKSSLEEAFNDLIVETFQKTSECISKVADGTIPNLVITDLKMNRTNGYLFAKELLSIDARIAVILHTAHAKLASRASEAIIRIQGNN